MTRLPVGHWPAEPREFAHLVHALRAAQKAGGNGDKTPADASKPGSLEQLVDAYLTRLNIGTIKDTV
jgi:hypothetical protein